MSHNSIVAGIVTRAQEAVTTNQDVVTLIQSLKTEISKTLLPTQTMLDKVISSNVGLQQNLEAMTKLSIAEKLTHEFVSQSYGVKLGFDGLLSYTPNEGTAKSPFCDMMTTKLNNTIEINNEIIEVLSEIQAGIADYVSKFDNLLSYTTIAKNALQDNIAMVTALQAMETGISSFIQLAEGFNINPSGLLHTPTATPTPTPTTTLTISVINDGATAPAPLAQPPIVFILPNLGGGELVEENLDDPSIDI